MPFLIAVPNNLAFNWHVSLKLKSAFWNDCQSSISALTGVSVPLLLNPQLYASRQSLILSQGRQPLPTYTIGVMLLGPARKSGFTTIATEQ